MRRRKIAIIGLGNTLLGDEGAGIHAIKSLSKMLKNRNVDLIEGGTSGMNIIQQFDSRKKIIFIDSGYCGLNPGQYVRFRPEEVISRKQLKGYSLHQFDLIKIIDLAKRLKIAEKVEIVIYCIHPDEIKISEELSPALKQSLPFLVEEVHNEVVRGESCQR